MSVYRTYLLILLVLLGLQGAVWWRTREILPDMSVVPEVPGKQTLLALSFGDPQFLFRVLGLQIQNAGDTFGRFTALYKYDYKKLGLWFHLLDDLDRRSHYIPALATYYYGQTQYTPDLRYVVNYLYDHAKEDVHNKWWWLVQAIYLANHKLEDKNLALKVAEPLSTDRTIPIWAQQMPAFIHEQRGEWQAALDIMEAIKKEVDAGRLTPGELNFMRYFVEERLKALEKQERRP